MADPHRPFVHLDVQSAFSVGGTSSSLPDDYIRALLRQHPLGPESDDQPRPVLALADYGLHSAVKAAVACARAGVEHIVGLRARLVAERSFRPWSEQPRELILLAVDDVGWTNMVQLSNIGHLSGGDWRGPRIDWRDLAEHAEGLVCLAGGPPAVGLLASYVEQSEDPDEPVEALLTARRLADIYGDRLYVALCFHGSPADKVVNRGLLAVAQHLELGVVATNAVRFATPEDALAHSVLSAMRAGRRADGVLNQASLGGDVPMVALDAIRAQAYLKSAAAMWRLFGTQLPAALEATVEVAQRCQFRLPLADRSPVEQRYGPGRFFGLAPARESIQRELTEVVAEALPKRCAETGRDAPTDAMRQRVADELEAINRAGLAELLLVAQQVGLECRRRDIAISARGSATSSLVAWALGLVELCPLDYGLDGQMFVHDGRPDLPDLDLEIPSAWEPAVAAFVQQAAAAPWATPDTDERTDLPRVHALRLGINVSLGARQAVRAVGAALGLEAPRLNALARQVPLLSSPGAIEQVMTHAPEMGLSDAPHAEPARTILSVAAKLEGLPYRHGPHPSAYTFSFFARSVLDWLPAQWVGADRPGGGRTFGAARHVAVVAREQASASTLAHPGAVPAHQQAPAAFLPDESNAADRRLAAQLLGDGPVLACQFDKGDLESLALNRLDISASASLGSAAIVAGDGGLDPDTAAAAWRLLEAGDTLCIGQVESLGIRHLLRRAREARDEHGSAQAVLKDVEDLAQLLALWRPGAWGKQREQAYLEARIGGARSSYIHPSTAKVLGSTAGQLLYVDQLLELIKGLGFEHDWAEQFRRVLTSGGGLEQRNKMEQVLRAAAAKHGWTAEQTTSLLGLLYEHVGYLYSHGHALQLARRAYEQAWLKVNPATVAAFFAEVLNNGGSTHYGLGTAVEEARQWGVALLPPCVQRSSDRYVVEDVSELEPRPGTGVVRVPLSAIRGLSPRAARHILIARKAFGGFGSLLDFCRKVDRSVVTRQDLLLLIKLGAFAWTGLSRGQLAFAEQYYAGAADLLRASDRDPSAAVSIEEDFAEGKARSLDVEDWPPEVTAAFELAHLGMYCVAPHEVQRHAKRLAEEFGVVAIAELVDYPDKAPVSVAGKVHT
ncbi:MAG: PHP domain-containing protein [Chloroflexi bacterium]|nr:PHP domain-containing protein [Chloroflexota bacterium]